MKRLAFFCLAIALLSCGAVYGNSFLDGMVGSWTTSSTVIATLNGWVISRETYRGEVRATKLKNGTYYFAGFTEKGIKDEETRYYKNGRFSSIYYTDEGDYSGEGSGTWRIRSGRLVIEETGETLEFERTALNYSVRRINRNSYATSGTGVVSTALPATANNTIRLRGTSTTVRLRK